MAFQHTRDSFALLDLQKEQEGGGDFLARAASFLEDEYEEIAPSESAEADEQWPVWEMRGRAEDAAHIAASERVFTVPEVYNEMLGEADGDGAGPCRDLFHCFRPWGRPAPPEITESSVEGAVEEASFEVVPETRSAQQNPVDRDDGPGDRRDGLPRGAIKRSSIAVQRAPGLPTSARRSFIPATFRASLGGEARRNQRRVRFSGLKQVLRVRKLTPEEALEVWFQVRDFAIFKNEMVSLTQKDGAARERAEAWLEAQDKDKQRRGAGGPRRRLTEGDTPAGVRPPLRRTDMDSLTVRDDSASADSWWHDYDHSRRGLERYASPEQARQILASLKVAVRQVLVEQDRQAGRFGRLRCHAPVTRDPDRIAAVYHEYTAWSRDLALAAGASDADAVQTDFDDDRRHSREYYLLKQVMGNGYRVHRHMPQFMLPGCIEPRGYIDEGESLYGASQRSSLKMKGAFQAVVDAASKGREPTGEEARKEMSQLNDGDLEGPVSPALSASLLAGKEGTTPPNPPLTERRRRSLAEKAKNYPFQQ